MNAMCLVNCCDSRVKRGAVSEVFRRLKSRRYSMSRTYGPWISCSDIGCDTRQLSSVLSSGGTNYIVATGFNPAQNIPGPIKLIPKGIQRIVYGKPKQLYKALFCISRCIVVFSYPGVTYYVGKGLYLLRCHNTWFIHTINQEVYQLMNRPSLD